MVRRRGAIAPEFMYVTPPRNREEMAARLIAGGIEQSAVDHFMGQF
jgi:hypothetical protein